MAVLSKGCKPDNFEPHNSLKLSFTNIRGLRSNFVECESFLESNSPDILALCETNLDDSIDSGNFSVRSYLPFILKGFYYSYAQSCSLCEGRTFFCMVLISRELNGLLLMFSSGFTSLSILLLFPLSVTFFVSMHSFLKFSQATHLLMCLSLETLNIHHWAWLTYSGGTDRPGDG